MLSGLVTLLLASSVSAVSRIYISNSGSVPNSQVDMDSLFPTTTKAGTGSVSVNSCWHDGAPIGAPTFRHPSADKCQQIEAVRQVKIYHNAVCSNGTEALFARWAGPGCVGEPASLDVVEDDMLKTCLKMPSEGPGSFAFWCEGEIESLPVKKPNNPSNNGGSGFHGLLIVLAIFLFVFLFALFRLGMFIHRCVTHGNRFLVSNVCCRAGRVFANVVIRGFSDGKRVRSHFHRVSSYSWTDVQLSGSIDGCCSGEMRKKYLASSAL